MALVGALCIRGCQLEQRESADGGQRGQDPLGPPSRAHAGQGHVLPSGVSLGPDLSVSRGGESMSAWSEVVADGTEWVEETLSVLG
jgi:hypothetical protein